jgi:predicted nucleotidyltransferase
MDKRDRLPRLALKIAKLLKEKYKVKRVFLIGSLVKGICA